MGIETYITSCFGFLAAERRRRPFDNGTAQHDYTLFMPQSSLWQIRTFPAFPTMPVGCCLPVQFSHLRKLQDAVDRTPLCKTPSRLGATPASGSLPRAINP